MTIGRFYMTIWIIIASHLKIYNGRFKLISPIESIALHFLGLHLKGVFISKSSRHFKQFICFWVYFLSLRFENKIKIKTNTLNIRRLYFALVLKICCSYGIGWYCLLNLNIESMIRICYLRTYLINSTFGITTHL